MRVLIGLSRICVALLALCAILAAADFTWDWHGQEVIGRGDTSVRNTSKLTESRRTELMQALVVRLQKSMSEQGYDDDRIHEVASTTRLRFVDLGDGKPVIMATSLGMEGGCDTQVNCPFWIFRHAEDGYVSLLDTNAASYTVQPTQTNDLSDLVISRHVTATESKLTLYKYADDKYSDAGCYTATWPAAKDGEPQAPEVAPCKPDNADSKP
jgi:hypothetical protein